MDKLLIPIVLVSLFLLYVLIELGGVYLMEKLGGVDKRLTRKQRIVAFLVLSLLGFGVVLYFVMTRDYRGLFG